MKRVVILLALLCLEKTLHAQTPHTPYIYTIKADSVKITNTCDTAELIIENHTQTVPGFLFNKGRGRTEFRRMISLSDSSLLLGGDTVVIRGSIYANNGLSLDAKTVQLGQLEGTPGNPAAFLSNREIPLNGKYLGFTGLGRIGIGTTAPRTILHINTSQTTIAPAAIFGGAYFGQLMSTDHGVMGCCSTEYTILTSGNSANVRGRFLLTKTRGSTSSPQAVQQGDIIGDFASGASDGTSMLGTGLIRFFVDGPVSTGNLPSALLFYTGATSLPERMRISSSGNVGIGTQSPIDKLHVMGTARITDTLKMPGIVSQSDTAGYKPVVVDAIGNVFKMAAWSAPARKSATVSAGTYTVPADVDVVFVNNSGGTSTVILPTGTLDREIVIKNLNATNNVILSGLDPSELSNTIATHGAITVKYTGNTWVGINKY